jgi:hypothetical protein
MKYSSTKYSVGGDIPVQNIQSVKIFQYKIFSRYKYSSTEHSVSRDISGQSSTKYSVGKDVSVQNIQSDGIFQGSNTNGGTTKRKSKQEARRAGTEIKPDTKRQKKKNRTQVRKDGEKARR